MLRVTCLTLVSLVLVTKILSVASSGICTQITETSGTIRSEKTANYYSKCWRISVPQRSKAQINLESFLTLGECSETRVEISLDNNDGERYIFCPRRLNREPLSLKGDFTVTHHMANPYVFFRSNFSLKFQIENLCSKRIVPECDDNGVCSMVSLPCDEAEQCSDGVDGKECGKRSLVDTDLTENRVNGIRWLKNKWSYTTGWQENTHRGITALFLASERDGKKVNVEEKLMIKQLEVQTLVYIFRKDTDEMTMNQLSMFVNALSVSCQNPHNFYGHDLVKFLKEELKVSSTITHSMAYLALCNAGATLPVNVTDDLNKLLKTNAQYPFLLDVQAITVMALSCLKVNYEEGLNTFPQSGYEEAIRKFKELQLDDGSFGNIYTTAVVTQALLSAGQESTKDWNYNKAVSFLIQYLNSAPDDFLAMYWILPILNGKCLSHIRNTNCSAIAQRDSVSDVKAKLGTKMQVQYSLNIGDEKDVVHTISLRVPQNITVFEVMQLAQDADSKYKFLAEQMGGELYIYDVAGITNDFEDGKFWLLYVGKDAESMRYTNESPDKIALQDGAHIIMWYKKAHI